MATIKQMADEYGVSKSTMRRWIMDCIPEVFNGKKLDLTEEQAHKVADYIEKNELVKTVHDSFEPASEVVYEPINETNDSDETLINRIHELELENASLKASNDSLNRSHELLVKQLEAMNEALKREQNMHVGFFKRLGQKLLGDGKNNH